MLQIDTEYRPERTGLQRRDFLRIGGLSALGMSLGNLLHTPAQAASAARASSPKAKACILMWMSGGPSHLDTFDLKPDAPEAYKGLFNPIRTNAPGIQICEHMPMLAKQADKFSIIRSMTHPSPSHETARHIMLTGNVSARGVVYPSYGSVVLREKGQSELPGAGAGAMPPYVAVPSAPDFAGAGYMGGSYKPLSVGSDPNRSGFRVSGLTLPSRLTVGRLEKRRELLKDVDEWQRQVENEPQFDVLDNFYKRSYEMITAPAVKKAFEIDKEPDELRERYGRNTFGQSCLLARRLVESGVSFVHIERGGWDNHGKIFAALSENRLPELDRGFSALLDDLSKRGLLDSTIVVWMGEFGRTPKVDWSDQWQGGRHHYSKCFCSVIGGGGFQGGRVVGSSGEVGEAVAERPVLPWDLGATMLKQMGIRHDTTYPDRGRNIRVLPFGTSVVSGGMLNELL